MEQIRGRLSCCKTYPCETRLSELKPFELYAAAPNLGKVLLCLLQQPAFLRAAENFGQSHGHFRRYAALPVDKFRKRVARYPKGGGGVRDGQA